jgi:hypothetical protein
VLVGQVGAEAGEDQHGTSLDHLDLRYLEIAETLAWPAQRRLGLPVDEVI